MIQHIRQINMIFEKNIVKESEMYDHTEAEMVNERLEIVRQQITAYLRKEGFK